jgi:hypothetical protein
MRDAISGIQLTDEEVAKGKPAADKVQSLINSEIRKLTEQEMERVAVEVNRAVSEASDRLQSLTSEIEETVKGIVLSFSASGTRQEQVGVAALGVAAIFLGGGLPVIGGIWAGYKQAGLAGAATGGAATFAALYAAGIVAAVIGLPLTLPVVIGAALIGFFSGDRITKMVFKGARAKQFKEKAIEQTLKQIDDMHLEADISRSTRKYVQDTFDRLTQMVSTDVDAVIENTRRTLDQLALQKERQDVLTGEQIRELDQIAERTTSIIESTKAVNVMLTARAAGAAI